MTRQSLYRRFRPQRFADVRGQDDLVGALRRAVAEDRVGQAYLFSGPRGTGKTTTARILAKALNCTELHDGEPCGTCPSCVAIAEGSSFDVFELDAASHNGVDAMRDLIERASQGTPGRRKVYILDEAHMLSKGAANALLKTLEEPPDHVVFVLATTDPQKLLPTIRSRTQHFEVHLLDTADLQALVDDVAGTAGLDVDDDTRRWAVRAGAGSARDTLSALERAAALGGIPDAVTEVDPLVDALAGGDTAEALQAVDRAVRAGRSPQDIGNEIIERLRQVFLATMGVPPHDLPDDVAAKVAEQATTLGARGTTHALEVLGDALVGLAAAPDPRVPLELAMMRITRPEGDSSPSALLSRIERLERALAAGQAPAGQTPAAQAAAPPPPAPPVAPPTAPAAAPPTTAQPQTPQTPETPQAPAPEHESTTGAPAAAARQALASHRRPSGQTTRRPPVAAAAPPPPPSASPSPAAPPPPDSSDTSDTSPADPAPPAAPVPPAAPAGPDRVADIWHDHVLQSADQKVRARFGTGRIVGGEQGTVVVAVPNDRVLQRCLPLKAQVQQVLSDQLGAPVTLELRVDPAAAAQPEPARAGSRPQPAADDPEVVEAQAEEIGDVHDLADAEDQFVDDIARLTEAFPGSKLIEPDQEPKP